MDLGLELERGPDLGLDLDLYMDLDLGSRSGSGSGPGSESGSGYGSGSGSGSGCVRRHYIPEKGHVAYLFVSEDWFWKMRCRRNSYRGTKQQPEKDHCMQIGTRKLTSPWRQQFGGSNLLSH